MEKTIKFEDVIAFIRKAMNDGLEIAETFRGMKIYDSNEDSFSFHITNNNKKLYIYTPKGYLNIDITEKEYNLYKVILDSVRDYIHDVAVKEFTDFFKDDENRVKDINDLDNDEE